MSKASRGQEGPETDGTPPGVASARATVVLVAQGDDGLLRGWRAPKPGGAGEPGAWRSERVLAGRSIRCLAVASDGAVWAGTQGEGLLRSRDGGASWEAAGLSGRIVKSVAPAPSDPAVVYAGLKPAGVAVSRDGGRSWTELQSFGRIRGRRLWMSPAEPPGTAYVQGLAVSPTDPAVVVAGIEFGAVVRSNDGGRTWSNHLPGSLRDCHSLNFHARDGARIYEGGAGIRRPLAVSGDGGRSWRRPEGAERSYGWACAADPVEPDTIYVSASSGPRRAHGGGPARACIYRSRAGGPLEALSGGLPEPLDGFPYALITDPQSAGHLYAGLSDGQIWFSAEHGERWHRLPVNVDRVERALAILF